MALQNFLSTAAAPFAHPQTAAQIGGQFTKRIRGIINIANGDNANSIYFIGKVPNTAVVTSIKLEGATISGVAAATVGLWDNQGNLKNASYYASALNLSSSAGLSTGDFGEPVWNAHASVPVANATQQVFQDAGDVEGPFPASGSSVFAPDYQIGLQIGDAATQAGSLVATVEYQCAE
jgi:hypothetical protein